MRAVDGRFGVLTPEQNDTSIPDKLCSWKGFKNPVSDLSDFRAVDGRFGVLTPVSGQNKSIIQRIFPTPRKILELKKTRKNPVLGFFLFKNPKKSDPKIRIQGHDSLKIRLCTVCVHKYYIPANGAEIGFSDFFTYFPMKFCCRISFLGGSSKSGFSRIFRIHEKKNRSIFSAAKNGKSFSCTISMRCGFFSDYRRFSQNCDAFCLSTCQRTALPSHRSDFHNFPRIQPFFPPHLCFFFGHGLNKTTPRFRINCAAGRVLN